VACVHLIEDDEQCASFASGVLRRVGHEVLVFSHPCEFFYELNRKPPHCAIVDWALPELNGLEIIRRIREVQGWRMGIVVLTALGCDERAVLGLEAGADDFIDKPVSGPVLAVRIEAVLRRVNPAETRGDHRIALGRYTLDRSTRRVAISGARVELAPREFDLAWTLFSQPSKVFTKAELLSAIWGRRTRCGDQAITQNVYALRKKLDLAANGVCLFSVYGTGYRLELSSQPPLPARGRVPGEPPHFATSLAA
jgi:DNA-binding response OmpR family regulator